jgi:AcrR family transcriptional regulator
MKQRSYRLGLREVSVDRHRTDMLAAAREVFSEAGYHGAGLEEVALRAGVSRKTVYYQFGSKMGLLEALVRDLESSAELAQHVQAIIEKPARIALREYFVEICAFWQLNQDFVRALNGLGATNADARKVINKHDRARRRRLRILVKLLATRGELRDDSPQERAVDLLWLLSSFGSFDHLVTRSRLTREMAATTLAQAATALLKAAP